MALLCHCHVVSDRTIVAHVEAGASSVDEVGDACGAGTSCGGCHDAIAAVIAATCARLTGSGVAVG